jgi:hypothetical protein
MWTNVVHRVVGLLYRVAMFLWRRFYDWPLFPTLNWLVTKQQQKVAKTELQSWWHRPHWIVDYLMRLDRKAQGIVLNLDDSSEGARKLWALIARHMFDKRFGIDLRKLEQEELNALYEASQGGQFISLANHLLMIATQAVGWGGLAAIRFAPSLRDRNYVIFSVFMIAIGLLYEWWLVRGMNDRYVVALLKLRGILRALEKAKGASTNTKKGEQSGH